MILNKDSITASGSGTSIMFHVQDKTPVFVNDDMHGDTVIHVGPVMLFFKGDNDMELVNLILSHRKKQGKSYY